MQRQRGLLAPLLEREAGSDFFHWRDALLGSSAGPIVAATGYVSALPERVRAYLSEGQRWRLLWHPGTAVEL